MAARLWTEDETVLLLTLVAQGESMSKIGAALNRSKNSVEKRTTCLGQRYTDAKEGRVARLAALEATPEDRTLESDGTETPSADELMRKHGLDPSDWTIIEFRIGKHVMGSLPRTTRETGGDKWVRPTADPQKTELWNCSLRIRPNHAAGALKQIGAAVLSDITKRAPGVWPSVRYTKKKGETFMLEMSVFDFHLGKLSWPGETGHAPYDLKIAQDLWRWAVTDLLAKTAHYNIDKIVLPIGSDFFNADNRQNTTTGGTPQDVDGRHMKVFRAGVELYRWALEQCEKIAPTDGVVVPGNHDWDAAFKLGDVLAAWYHASKHIHIDNGLTSRKYVEYGINGLLLAHGSEEKIKDLGQIFAHEQPALWARTECREAHLGHFHHSASQSWRPESDEFTGFRVRLLPSLASADNWHAMKGYLSRRAAEALVWSRTSGYAGHVSTSILKG